MDYPPLPEGLIYGRDAYTPTLLERFAPRGKTVPDAGVIPQRILDMVAALKRGAAAK